MTEYCAKFSHAHTAQLNLQKHTVKLSAKVSGGDILREQSVA